MVLLTKLTHNRLGRMCYHDFPTSRKIQDIALTVYIGVHVFVKGPCVREEDTLCHRCDLTISKESTMKNFGIVDLSFETI